MTGVIRVAVVDDQAVVRMGLGTLVGSDAGLELVGEAGDGRAGLAVIRATRPDHRPPGPRERQGGHAHDLRAR